MAASLVLLGFPLSRASLATCRVLRDALAFILSLTMVRSWLDGSYLTGVSNAATTVLFA